MTTSTAQLREFKLPDLGEGLTEATIVNWHVAVGDTVSIDQIIVEVESAKAVVELPVPFAGTVAELCGGVGDVIELGDVLIRVAEEGSGAEVLDAPAAAADGPVSGADVLEAPSAEDAVSSEYSGAVLTGYGLKESTVRLARPEGGRFKKRSKCDVGGGLDTRSAQLDQPRMTSAQLDQPKTAGAPRGHDASLIDESRNSPVMSPLVRREAKQAGFDARHLAGSGRNGLVVRADVEAAVAVLGGASSASVHEPAHAVGEDTRIPVTGMRALVAEHMAESHASVPKATIWLDVDATPLLDLRAQLQQATGEKFSLTTLIARIVVAGLAQHPRLNASFDAKANEIVEHAAINLGVAAQTPRGLTVPVVHGVEQMNLRELREGIGEIVEESKRGNFPPAKLAGGTFTLNNYGGFGVDGASPIINLPQAAMLGIGRLKERPWVVDGELAVRKVMTVSFVFDHRVCDGDAASAFLTFVTDRIERPALLFADL